MSADPDYSCAYVVLETDHPAGLSGHGLTFTTGRGTELCVAAVEPAREAAVVRWRFPSLAASGLAAHCGLHLP